MTIMHSALKKKTQTEHIFHKSNGKDQVHPAIQLLVREQYYLSYCAVSDTDHKPLLCNQVYGSIVQTGTFVFPLLQSASFYVQD